MTGPRRRSVRVWDPAVRLLHWSLVAGVAASWITRDGGGRLHEWLGYATLAVVVSRALWGFVGPAPARFAQFVRGPGETWRYARLVAAGREPRYIGHNPLGAAMIVALLATVAFVCLTGWLYTTDRFWGVGWVERAHAISSDALLALVALHVAGVVFASIRHRDNLVAAMLHGRKRAAEDQDAKDGGASPKSQ